MIRTFALALAVVALLPAMARADTFTVNTTADTAGAAGCPANCTIRNAISAAAGNGTAVDDTIVVPAGAYTVNSQLGALTFPTGSTRITIQGAGANTTSIQPPAGVRALVIGTSAGVTVTGITLRGSAITTGQGGSVLVSSQATATFNRVRITGGSAPQGGGIAATGATALTIQSSLIDTNSATGTAGAGGTGIGGGLYVQGQTTATPITIQDTTIVTNTADNGGGIGIQNNVGQPPALRGVTLARNNARAGQIPGIGGIYSANTNARFQGSIITGNTTTINLGAGSSTVPGNCSLTPAAATDDGGNVTPDTDQCGLSGVHTDPQLAAALDTSEPPALSIPANSSAVDIAACGTRTVDQRGVARPQGSACDAGAYEYQAPPPVVTPTPTPAAPPVTTPVPTPTATPTATPPPVRNRSVGAAPTSGTVLVRQPGTTKFLKLTPTVIKNGSEVDARKGRVEITTSTNEKAVFYDGIFKVSQAGGITTLTLSEKLTGCPKAKGKASAAAKKPKTRKLWGNGKGKFRTKGSYSAATVRGTQWLVQDRCTSTLTRVAQGVVSVRDEVKKKTLTLRKGKSYTARARK